MPDDNNRKEVLDLVESCRQYILGRKEIAEECCGPYSPALFVLLGNACRKENAEQLRETIRLGWSSLQEYIEYLEYPGEISYDRLIEDANHAIETMQQAPAEVFQNCNTIKIFLFLDFTDIRIESYLDLFRQKESIGKNIDGDSQVVLFAMLDKIGRKNRQTTNAYIREIMGWKKQKRIAGAVFLGSQLKSGRILSEEERAVNYRIAADIAYISDSRAMDQTGSRMEVSRRMESDILEDGQVCTVAYIKQSKPSEAIARILLRAMVDLHLEQESEIIKSREFDKYSFWEKLKDNGGKGVLNLTEVYESAIRKNFPSAGLFRYLPYSEGLESHKGEFASAGEVVSLLSPQARSVLENTERYYFLQSTDAYLADNRVQLRTQIEKELEQRIPYMEFLEYCKKKEQLEAMRAELEHMSFFSVPQQKGAGSDAAQLLWLRSCDAAIKYFYEQMGPICLEAFDHYLKRAEQFREIVKTTQNYLNQGLVDPIRKNYYTGIVRRKVNYSEHRQDYQRVFETMHDWCTHLQQLFCNLVEAESKELNTTFEEEQKLILDANPTAAIMEQLGFKNQRLMDECRLEYGNVPSGKCYCLAYAGAEFVDELQKQEKDMGLLFTSSRQDCAERLMICQFSCDSHYFDEGEEVSDEDSEG
jgi:hypothetical protein